MCYDLSYIEIKRLEWELKQGPDANTRRQLREKLEKLKTGTIFWARGFSHPSIPIVFNQNGQTVLDNAQWGLVPRWVKGTEEAQTISNMTLIARESSVFTKASFKHAAENKRCLVPILGFFEHHHRAGKVYPYFITAADGALLFVAGICDEANIEGASQRSFTIVTVEANERLKQIHNAPPNAGRMPLLLSENDHEAWLMTDASTELGKAHIKGLMRPLANNLLNYTPVSTLSGKTGAGNTPKAHQPFTYAALAIAMPTVTQTSLF